MNIDPEKARRGWEIGCKMAGITPDPAQLDRAIDKLAADIDPDGTRRSEARRIARDVMDGSYHPACEKCGERMAFINEPPERDTNYPGFVGFICGCEHRLTAQEYIDDVEPGHGHFDLFPRGGE